jgi:alanine racemase
MIHLDDILQATGAQVIGPVRAREFPAFCHDTRQLNPGELFVAVTTPWGDGHDYLSAAVAGGAAGVLCQLQERVPAGVTAILVPDVRRALVDWASHILRTCSPDVIAVTGSAGKTSTKEAVATVLASRFPTFRSAGNQNDLFGLPLSLGRFRPEQHHAVLEMACDRFGEIAALAAMAPPRVAVVTCVREAHLETLGTLDAVAQEKGDLVAALPADGWAVLNADDARVVGMAGRTAAHVRTFGCSPAANTWAETLSFDWQGTNLVLHDGDRSTHFRIPLLGWPSAYIAAAAAAVGQIYGLGLDEVAATLAHLSPLPGRLRPLAGRLGLQLLDDTYSAIPASGIAALDTLEVLPAGRRVAVIGDMPGLGAFEDEGLRQVGQRAARVLDRLVTHGDRATRIAEAARAAGLADVRITYTHEDAAQHAREGLEPGDAVLVKGPPEGRLEQVVEHLLADPGEALDLLVRQTVPAHQMRRQFLERPTWVELDLEAIAGNCERLVALAGPGVDVMVVLKADAYGHGAVRIAHTVLAHGATRLAVACLSEAVLLRQAGIDAPILIPGYVPPWQARAAILNDVTCAVFSEDVVQALSTAALDLRATARLHLKVDTGMGRLGLFPAEVLAFMQKVGHLPGVVWEGILTHFPVADDPAEDTYTEEQVQQFLDLLDELEAAGFIFPLIHAANSAGLVRFPSARFNLVRPGIALYGLAPGRGTPLPEGFRPALRFKTTVAQVKTFPPGASISYGRTYRTTGEQRIAVLPVGYADGFRRAPRHWGEVLVRGRRAPIVGQVCMDYTMVDVTPIPGVRPGDEVVLIGQQGDEELTVEEVAERLGTINYEVVSQILARVPRLV